MKSFTFLKIAVMPAAVSSSRLSVSGSSTLGAIA